MSVISPQSPPDAPERTPFSWLALGVAILSSAGVATVGDHPQIIGIALAAVSLTGLVLAIHRIR